MNGILPLWKPVGMTSHDCVGKLRGILKMKRIGHTGTLDPGAEGVLPMCIGKATKLTQYITSNEKEYIAEVILGQSTDTEDSYGHIIETKDMDNMVITHKAIIDVIQEFIGEITQLPPYYSAVKVNGKKLYEYARENEYVERPKRHISIHDIQVISPIKNNRFKMKVRCSKGTYIRTLCVDIGKKLDCPAHMGSLIRTKSGNFTRENAFTFEEIEKAVSLNDSDSILLPMQTGLPNYDVLSVDEHIKMRVTYGQKLEKPSKPLKTDPFLVMYQEELLALYMKHPQSDDEIKPVCVLTS